MVAGPKSQVLANDSRQSVGCGCKTSYAWESFACARFSSLGERRPVGWPWMSWRWNCKDLRRGIRINSPLFAYVRVFLRGHENLRFTIYDLRLGKRIPPSLPDLPEAVFRSLSLIYHLEQDQGELRKLFGARQAGKLDAKELNIFAKWAKN